MQSAKRKAQAHGRTTGLGQGGWSRSSTLSQRHINETANRQKIKNQKISGPNAHTWPSAVDRAVLGCDMQEYSAAVRALGSIGYCMAAHTTRSVVWYAIL